MAYIYAQTGPPFNFLGNLSESQRVAFATWVTQQSAALPAVQTHHQIRAQQMRKTAGMLEAFYAAETTPLAPTFVKDSWKPSNNAHHFPYAPRNDHEPAMVVGKVKEYFRSSLVSMDDAVFHMNHVRTMIERNEDLAQYSKEAQTKVTALMNRLQTLFGQPEYKAALVNDQSDLYEGQPRYRVHQLDDPTPWERATRSGHRPLSASENAALGTKLTAQALRESAAASVQLHFPANANGASADLENRVHNQSTTAPLLDRIAGEWDVFEDKVKAFGQAVSGNTNTQPVVDTGFYKPGQDASSK